MGLNRPILSSHKNVPDNRSSCLSLHPTNIWCPHQTAHLYRRYFIAKVFDRVDVGFLSYSHLSITTSGFWGKHLTLYKFLSAIWTVVVQFIATHTVNQSKWMVPYCKMKTGCCHFRCDNNKMTRDPWKYLLVNNSISTILCFVFDFLCTLYDHTIYTLHRKSVFSHECQKNQH